MTGVADLAGHLRAVLQLDPAAPAIQFAGTWHRWGDLAAVAGGIADTVATAGLPPGSPVGLVLRNDPAMVGALLGVLLAGGCAVTINATQGDEGLSRDLRELQLPLVVALEPDWQRPGVTAAAAVTGSLGLAAHLGDPAGTRRVDGLADLGPGPHRAPLPGTAVEMLTSGTTGPPKRVPLAYDAFARTLAAATAHYRVDGAAPPGPPRLRSSVAIVSSPLVHMSGLFRTLLNLGEGRRIALLDRFTVDGLVALVREHRPRALSLVPAALRMVLDAGVAPDDLASVEVVTSGTAPLPVTLQDAFEARYGVAVLPSYGATEFAGGVAGWTLALHREWAAAKRGSVGRPQAGRGLRVTRSPGDEEVPPGEQGRIEVRTGDGPWVRTTDVGRVDADGFVWIDGRADDVIIRGGFKVSPSAIADALREHPAVRDAGVAGLDDDRVGAVPVAAVELHAGTDARTVTGEDLLDHLRSRLSPYQVPARLRVVDLLPRTASLKVSQPGIRALFEPEVAP